MLRGNRQKFSRESSGRAPTQAGMSFAVGAVSTVALLGCATAASREERVFVTVLSAQVEGEASWCAARTASSDRHPWFRTVGVWRLTARLWLRRSRQRREKATACPRGEAGGAGSQTRRRTATGKLVDRVASRRGSSQPARRGQTESDLACEHGRYESRAKVADRVASPHRPCRFIPSPVLLHFASTVAPARTCRPRFREGRGPQARPRDTAQRRDTSRRHAPPERTRRCW